ncbi:MAG: SprT-like domain-containing protein [bacterium]
MTITRKEYTAFQQAYDYFNRELLSGKLPACLITLTHSKKYGGFFHRERFSHRRDERKTDELSLNIDSFHHMSHREILAILVHEMVHLWQFHSGKPSRNGYHKKEWSNRMKTIGLMPSDTGQPGGNITAQSMNHYIIEGGRYDCRVSRFAELASHAIWAHALITHYYTHVWENSKSLSLLTFSGRSKFLRPSALSHETWDVCLKYRGTRQYDRLTEKLIHQVVKIN